jgi:hypothetical protein
MPRNSDAPAPSWGGFRRVARKIAPPKTSTLRTEAPILDFNVLVVLLARRSAYREELRRAKGLLDEARAARDSALAAIAQIEEALATVTAGVEIKYDTDIPRALSLDELIALIVPPPLPAPAPAPEPTVPA